MTNTHITIGGHKVTVNKVGQVHTPSAQTGAPTISWVVTNGLCCVYLSVSPPSAGTYNLTGFPKAKITASASCVKSRTAPSTGMVTIDANTTTIVVDTQDATSHCTLVYPVADDWVES